MLLFALIFKYLPNVSIAWKYVWIGAIVTSFIYRIRYGVKPLEADKEGILVTKVSVLIKESVEKAKNSVL
jgi:glucose-6-phosphate-specific signal transduction histidine kinase